MQTQEAKKLIGESKNICLVPGQEPESISCALALFYTLKELGKNVNFICDTLPENFKFMVPSLDFISSPRNLVISIPNNMADISQIYYEKGEDSLKIHLTVGRGNIKKENVSFYFAEPKPDLVITVGVQDFKEMLSNKLNSFGFLLDSPVLNIDNKQNNQNFGIINLTGNCPLAEITAALAKGDGGAFSKETAKCLLASLVCYTGNFQKNMTAEVFETAGQMMKMGAPLQEITDNLKGNW